MKLHWITLQVKPDLVMSFILLLITIQTNAAIVPPPWSDPQKNPCAIMPGGWQLLYWPPLDKCFKIFTIGYPCPETMELTPGSFSSKTNAENTIMAECRCPPGTALNANTNKCFEIFTRGPCKAGQYFSPISDVNLKTKGLNNRLGECKEPKQCFSNMIYSPTDNKCYTQFTKGPCAKGKLLVLNEDGFGECLCSDVGELRTYFYNAEGTCHEHYTKGPCPTPGHLFLPGGHCGCNTKLPHYYENHKLCYELDTTGPCPRGHIFHIHENVTISDSSPIRAQCQCKEGYIPWTDGQCYRLYTRGPCEQNEFLINSTTCVRNICGKNRLYFPAHNACYRVGSKGPCAENQVVVFDFTTRTSIDGISYNGICGCSGVLSNLDLQCSQKDTEEGTKANICDSASDMVELNGNCYKLYSRGPCGAGQWLEPLKTHIEITQRFASGKAKCVCRPGYTSEQDVNGTNVNMNRCDVLNVKITSLL